MVGREAKVRFDYEKVEVDELNLQVGDIIKNVTAVPDVDGWCEGEIDGKRGMFPSNFVEFLPTSSAVAESPPTTTSTTVTADISPGSSKNIATELNKRIQDIYFFFIFISSPP